MLQLGFLLVILFLVVWAAVDRPRWVLFAAIFLAPWSGLVIDVGVRLAAFQIVMATLAVALLLSLLHRPLAMRMLPVSSLFVILCIYVVIRSLIQIPFLPALEVSGGQLRSPLTRASFQILRFALDVSPVLVVPLLLRGSRDVWHAGKVYILSCMILAILGWFQLASWYGTGWNPLPLGLVDSLFGRGASLADAPLLREGIAIYNGVPLYRMNSLGGEPKDLSVAFAVALLLLQVAMIQWGNIGGRRSKLVWPFLFVSMLATLATTGLVIWLLGTLSMLALHLTFRFGGQRRVVFTRWLWMSVSVPAVIVVIGAAFVSISGVVRTTELLDIAKERTIRRASIEDFDAAVIGFLADQPHYAVIGVGLGNVHLYANDYLPDYAAFARNTAFVARAGSLRLLSELGTAGLLLFLAWIVAQIGLLVRRAKLSARSPSSNEASVLALALGQFAAIICIFYLARGNMVAPQTFLTLGLVVGLTGHMFRLQRSHPIFVTPTGRG